MDRVATSQPAALQLRLYDVDGSALVGTAATVTGTSRRDGAAKFTDEAATDAGGGSLWQLALDGDEVTVADVLDTVWTVTTDDGPQTRRLPVEFAGGHYAPVGAVRSKVGTATYLQVLQALSAVAERIEVVTGWVWVPRWIEQTLQTDRQGRLRLPKVPVRTLTAATDADGNTIDVDGWVWNTHGIVHTGRPGQRITVAWEAGEDQPPADLADAALDAAEYGAREMAIRDRRQKADLGDGRFPFQNASLRHGRPFGIDGVDVVVMSHQRVLV